MILLLQSSIIITRYDYNTSFAMKNPLHYFDNRYASEQAEEIIEDTLILMMFLANEDGDSPRLVDGDFDRREIAVKVRSWTGRLHRYGVTKGLVKELNECMLGDMAESYFKFDIDELVLRVKFIPFADAFGRRRGVGRIAYIFCEMLQRGNFRNLKRCEADGCSKYHVRRGIWCSDACGSRERQRKMRRLKREGQML